MNTKKYSKSIVAIVVSFMIAMSIALIGLTGLTAYAATGEIGKNSFATITLENGGTDSAKVESTVAEGQYMLYFDVTDPKFTGDDEAKYQDIYLQLTWGEGENTYYEYLTYNPELGMYYAMLPNVKGGDEITFSANYDTEYVYAGSVTGNAYLGGLALGRFNDYGIGNVNLPAEIELQLEEGQHIISVAPYYYGPAFGETDDFDPTYTVTIGDTTVTLVKDEASSYTYTGLITIPDIDEESKIETVTATITGENAGDYAVDVRVYNYKEPIELPADGRSIDMNYNEPYLFAYTATKTGYQKVEATGTVTVTITEEPEEEGGEPTITTEDREVIFSLAEKTSPLSIRSTNFPVSGYPVYLTAGETYYFEITYAEIEGIVIVDPDNPPAGVTFDDVVNATISVTDWTETTAVLNEVAYVPVNVTGDAYRVMLDFEGSYDISLAIFPEDFDFLTDSIDLHVGSESYVLNLDTNFMATGVNMTGVTYMYATGDKNAVIGLVVSEAPERKEIAVGTAEDVTLTAGGSDRFSVTGLEANVPYQVTLTGIESGELVEVSGPNGIIVAEGESEGVFIVNANELSYFFLDIYNYDYMNDVTFNILVERASEITPFTLNEDNTVALASGETRIYRVDLPVGDYAMRISGDANIRAYSANGIIVDEYNDEQVGRLSVYGESETVTVYIFFVNYGSEAVTAHVVLTNLAGSIELDTNNSITLSNKYVAYAMDLENDTYSITLNSTVITVTVGNTVVINYGSRTGEFTVNIVGAETNEILLFFEYSGETAITFTVYVEATQVEVA